jgi:ComF family protein
LVYGLLRRLFVELCPSCGGPSRGGFCSFCAREFARVVNACPRCGLAQPVTVCPRGQAPWHVAAVLAPFSYEPPLDHYVLALKYAKARLLGRALALLVAAELTPLRGSIDALVAVPLHRSRLRERGYNQAQEIARALSSAVGLPALERGIGRYSVTASQTRKGFRERRASVKHAFRVERDLELRSIAIVDDVLTTGATANALAAELMAAGAARCIVVAVARTPEPQARKM